MRLLPVALALLGALQAPDAQTPRGARLTGTVTDAESNLRVPGAVIELEGVA